MGDSQTLSPRDYRPLEDWTARLSYCRCCWIVFAGFSFSVTSFNLGHTQAPAFFVHSTKFATLCPFSYELLHFIGFYITLAPWYITHSIWRLSLFIYCFDHQSLIVYSKTLDGSWGGVCFHPQPNCEEPSLNANKNRWLIRLQPWLAGLACLAV